MTRIFLADDHPVVREGLKRIMEEDGSLEVVGEASTSSETLRRVVETDADVLLLDLEMPGRGGLEVLGELKERKPDLAVLVVSMLPEDVYAVRSLRSAAAGFLAKESIPDELLQAIKQVARGGRYISPSVAEELAAYVEEPGDGQPHELLSDREFQVLRLLAEGMTVTEIGEELSLSPKTISTYRARILEKTGFENNAQLIRYAVENDLV